MGAGGFLVYTAVKGEHPWALAKATVGAGAAAGASPTNANGSTATSGAGTGVQVSTIPQSALLDPGTKGLVG
jgi:uncharacterized spore protein YtfJ